jgi:hypothetical protein
VAKLPNHNHTQTKETKLEDKTLDNLIKLVVAEAQYVEFWKRNGSWGDGKLVQAKIDLKSAIRELKAFVKK